MRSVFLVIVALLWALPAAAAERPLLAVLDFTAPRTGLSQDEVVELSELARAEALDRLGGQYDIITRENLVDLLKSHGKTLEKCQGECETETGRMIGADVVVSGAVRKAFGAYTLVLKAHSTSPPKVLGIEKGKTEKKKEIPQLITSAAARLYSRLGGGAAREEGDSGSGGSGGGSGGGWKAGGGGGGAVIRFESEPAGAVVMVDGSMVCQSTPCQKTLAPGFHKIEMHKDKYVSGREERRLAAGETVRLELAPNFGFLRVVSEPPGLPATIDGKPVGVTPTKDLEMSLGRHRVEVTGPCHYKAWTKPSVARGERQEVKLSPEAKPAGLEVSAQDGKGNDLVADVYVDGKKLGRTPGTFTVTTCARKLEVRSGKHGSFREDLSLKEKKTAKVVATFNLVMARQVIVRDEMKQGAIFLKSDQAATSYRVDGTSLKGKLKAGKSTVVRVPFRKAPYRVLLSKKGFYPHESKLVITRDTPVATLNLVMAREVERGEVSGTGLLVIKSDPENATVFIDNVRQEKRTPSTYEIAGGKHSVRIQRRAYIDWTGVVEIKASDITEHSQKLTPDFAEVKLTAKLGSGGGGGPAGKGFVRIEPGTFTMGSPGSEQGRYDDEGPTHRVTISQAFALQSTEVTQGQWKAMMGTNPSNFASCGDLCPVEQVSWWDALAYVNALSKKEGLEPCFVLSGCRGRPGDESYRCTGVKVTARGGNPLRCVGYRLPTEAEWEYAARSGATGARYGSVGEVAWHKGNSGGKSHPVGKKRASPWGLYDMLGNVYEWTWDPRGRGAVKAPAWPGNGWPLVCRGGSWLGFARYSRAASRESYSAGHRRSDLGFRPARSLPHAASKDKPLRWRNF